MYLEAISIKNTKSQSMPEDLQDSSSNDRPMALVDLSSFSPRDLEFIVKFSEEHGPDTFRQLLQSICPSIFGHELVKGNLNTIVHIVSLKISCYFIFGYLLIQFPQFSYILSCNCDIICNCDNIAPTYSELDEKENIQKYLY